MKIKNEDTKVGNVYYIFQNDWELHARYIAKTVCVKEKKHKLTETYINGELLEKDVEWEYECNSFKIEEIVFSLTDACDNIGDIVNCSEVYSNLSEAFEMMRCFCEEPMRFRKRERWRVEERGKSDFIKENHECIESLEKKLFSITKALIDNGIVNICTAKEDIIVEMPLEFYGNKLRRTYGIKDNEVVFDELMIDNHDGFHCSSRDYKIVALKGQWFIVDKKPTISRCYSKSVMAKGVIPKGSRYFYDTNGEIITNQIKLLYPFWDEKRKLIYQDELKDTEGIA